MSGCACPSARLAQTLEGDCARAAKRRKQLNVPLATATRARLNSAPGRQRRSSGVDEHASDVEAGLLCDFLEAGGLVTDPVRLSPITSSPASSSRPRGASTRPMAVAISRSRSLRAGHAPPPAARLPCGFRRSCGMRASENGTGSPSITRMRLSPLTIWQALHHQRSLALAVQRLDDAAQVQAVGIDAKMPMPPMPSSGLRMMSRCFGFNWRASSSALRVTSVGPMYWGTHDRQLRRYRAAPAAS